MPSHKTLRRSGRRSAFTLVEILIVVIILGILAAIVIPQFSGASEDARNSSVTSQLQTLRTQIQLFQLEHADTPPVLKTTGTSAAMWAPLMTKTDAAGGVTGPLEYGPYIAAPPVNPLTNSSTIANSPAVGVGWVWDGKTLSAVNKDGTVFVEN